MLERTLTAALNRLESMRARLRTLVTLATATSASAQFCCRGMMASCLACEQGITVEEYCALHPGEWDCPSKAAQGSRDGTGAAPRCPPEEPRPFATCTGALSCAYDEVCCDTTGVCLNVTQATCQSGMWVLMVAAVHCPREEPPRPMPSPSPPSISLCPASEQVRCFAEPCKVARCDARPEARCFNDYCGGCHARFFDARTSLPVTQCNSAPPPSPSKPRPLLSPLSLPPSPAKSPRPPREVILSTPALPPSTPAILLSLTAAGGVEDYDDAVRAVLVARLATVTRVPAALITLAVVPGSVRILASIAVPSSRRPTDLSSELRSR